MTLAQVILVLLRLLEQKCVRQFLIGVSPSGKAPVFGIGIRWFESSHPSHRLQLPLGGCFCMYSLTLNEFNCSLF